MTTLIETPRSGSAGNRSALLIANDVYLDAGWSQLGAAVSDAEALAKVLGDQGVGGFKVDVLANQSAQDLRFRLAEFFADRAEDDLLVLHLGCHGELDASGGLHFAASDTSVKHVAATGVPAALLRDLMQNSGSERIVLFLDCCFSAAFVARGNDGPIALSEELQSIFSGRGHAILSATTATQQAWEMPDAGGAVFTRALIDGLRSGEADIDGDGWVSLEDLHGYLSKRMSVAKIQTPTLSLFGLEGKIVIAAAAAVEASGLPAKVALAIASPMMPVRRDAIVELASLLDGDDEATARAARLALHRLTNDDSKTVSAAAERVLDPTLSVASGKPSRRATASGELEGLHRDQVSTELVLAEVPIDALVQAIDGCQRALSLDETRPSLTSFNLRFLSGELIVMTTDSYRLSEARIPAPKTSPQPSIALPARATQELRDLLVRSDQRIVRIGQVGGQVTFAFNDSHAWCYSRDALSLEYRSLFPPADTSALAISRSSLLDTVVKVEKQTPKSRAIRLVTSQGRLRVRAPKHQRGLLVDGIKNPDVPNFEVGLDPSFVKDALTSLRGDMTNLVIQSPLKPVLLAHPPSQLMQLIMPIRLAD